MQGIKVDFITNTIIITKEFAELASDHTTEEYVTLNLVKSENPKMKIATRSRKKSSKERNPNKHDRNKFSKEEVAKLWTMQGDKYYQIILMLLYNGTRISEFLDLKKEHVHLDEQYFDVIESKTENGIRKVPIADKLLPFYKAWYESCPDCEYLLHTEDGKHFKYRNYYDSYWHPLVEQLGINRTPHCTRHTCISMLSEAGVQDTTIKKIVGHSGAMTLTEKVYTHLDMQVLVDAINKTLENQADVKSA